MVKMGRMMTEIDRVAACTTGFPCQDLSTAGARKGLEGERSGLFFEILRIASEVLPRPPKYLFLENVLGIRSSGLLRVLECLASMRYDVRWSVVSASSLGAHHQRQRWFALCRLRQEEEAVADPEGIDRRHDGGGAVHEPEPGPGFEEVRRLACWSAEDSELFVREPSVPRVVDGGSGRELDESLKRNRALGNAVCPPQAKYAFSVLSGLLPYTGPSAVVKQLRAPAKSKPKPKQRAKKHESAKPKRNKKSRKDRKRKPPTKPKTALAKPRPRHASKGKARVKKRVAFEPDPVHRQPAAHSGSGTSRYFTRSRVAKEPQAD